MKNYTTLVKIGNKESIVLATDVSLFQSLMIANKYGNDNPSLILSFHHNVIKQNINKLKTRKMEREEIQKLMQVFIDDMNTTINILKLTNDTDVRDALLAHYDTLSERWTDLYNLSWN